MTVDEMRDLRDAMEAGTADDDVRSQAARLEAILPAIMRRLFPLEPDHPAAKLPVAQLRVCSILQDGPRSVSSISEELNISLSAVTQLADRLERAGFVQRCTEGDDRRVRFLALTEQGGELMALRRASRVRNAAEALAQLAVGDRAILLTALEQLRQAVLDLPRSDVPHDPVGARVRF